jgi:hypothetical protein
MSKKFIKKKEDFVCERCGREVFGDGFTNHCPICLFSKHVDIFPGDRKCNCEGLMAPTRVHQDHGEYIITHRCLSCGEEKTNKKQKDDDFETLLSVVKFKK